LTKARKKVKQDTKDIKNGEWNRMFVHGGLWWLRGFVSLIEYWFFAFSFPISIIILLITGDFWKALGFFFVVQVRNTAGNLRGLDLHLEGLIEWLADENF